MFSNYPCLIADLCPSVLPFGGFLYASESGWVVEYSKKTSLFVVFAFFFTILVTIFAYRLFFNASMSGGAGFAQHFATKTLSNGMKILAIKNSASPRVVVELVYAGVGASLERPEEKGVAHAIEHMVFKGTKTLAEGAINSLVLRYGAQTNAFTMVDATGYWFEVDANNWKPFITLLADCMENAVFDEQCFAAEVKTILQELRQNGENPAVRLTEAFIRGFLPVEHPYHALSGGNVHDLALVTTQKMSEFYKKYYRPEFATLVIVGDVDPKKALEFAEGELSKLSSEQTRLPDVFAAKPIPQFGVHKVVYDRHKTSHVLVGWPIPKGGEKEYACARIVCELLDSGVNGVLQKRLVDRDHCAERLDAEIIAGRGSSFFYITCHPLKNKIDQCVHAILEELYVLEKKGVGEHVIASILKKMKVDAAVQVENITTSGEGLPGDWVERYAMTENVQDFLNPLRLFDEVTVQEVQNFVAKFLTVERMSRVDMLPLSDEVRPAWQAQRNAGREVERKILQTHVRTRPIVEPVIPQKYPEAHLPVVTFPQISLQKRLDNGMQVVVVKRPDAPVCTIHIGHRDAQYYDLALDGMPLNVACQMLLEGTEALPGRLALDWLDERGVSYNFSRCDWSATCLSQDAWDVLDHLCRMIHQPIFEASTLKRVKKRLANTALRMKDCSSDVQGRAIAKSLWPNTVYDWSFDEGCAAIMSVTPESLKLWHEKLSNPAALVCVVVGNVDAEDVIKKMQENTADWKSIPYVSERSAAWAEPVVGCDIPTESRQTHLAYVRPSAMAFGNPYLPSLRVLSQALFKSFGSRLFNLREATGLFYGAEGEFALGMSKVPGYDFVSAHVGLGKLSDAERRLRQFITHDIAKSITQDDLNGARAGFRSEIVAMFAGVDSCAAYFVDLERKGLGEDYYAALLHDVDALDVATVSSVARDYAAAGAFARVRVGGL